MTFEKFSIILAIAGVTLVFIIFILLILRGLRLETIEKCVFIRDQVEKYKLKTGREDESNQVIDLEIELCEVMDIEYFEYKAYCRKEFKKLKSQKGEA